MSAFDLTPRLARESTSNGKDTILFDKALPGFGLRIHPSGRKVWIVQARIEGRSRRIVIARHGEIELAEARRRARDMLARIRAGGNPADDIQREKKTPTLREFADEYLRRSEPHWKPSGPGPCTSISRPASCPRSAGCRSTAIGPEDVAAWFDAASRDRPGAANRAFEILRAMMFRAEEWGLRERGSNPCLGIAKNPREQVARFLDTDELARLGRALDARRSALARGRRRDPAAGAHRMPPQRGARSALARHRRGRLEPRRFEDGPARRAARRGRAGAHRGAARYAQNRCVPFSTSCRGEGHLQSHDVLAGGLRRCRTRQASPARPSTYRRQPGHHGGENLPLVGRLLGHRRHRTTAGYAHLADAHLVEAVEKVGIIIAQAMAFSDAVNPVSR